MELQLVYRRDYNKAYPISGGKLPVAGSLKY